ncbi:TetR/AcrR family transcriptional regulator C-terminal domain-containing protein [Kitasatospora sp. GP82]|uniref:TetR/AcrR family transcriptional regulator C-terminal domain-containing protein n=1 Tax=Kitasatospora sp. GP82 TaxID=3035089 RepID=UPI002475CE13|nr:TetR/AcrR family transcriptional regulator C-terminal domain-containing protein [Kitasatospora sp. GP82]MDH6127950.1 TetR/AcrR family tetracycline transcriptional repressor [Kitasatospora sp. GP82]
MAQKLDRAQVVETALRLLNETGLEGLTLRRIATELDCKAPALYWHFANKQALLDELATEMLRRMIATTASPGPDAPWQEWITATSRALRSILLSCRDGAKVFSGTRLTETVHAERMDGLLGALVRAGFAFPDAVEAYFASYAFTVGFVIEEQAVEPLPGQRAPGYDEDERAALIGPDFPLAAAAGAGLFSGYEERFERGLAVVVAGVEAVLGPKG